MKKNLMGDAATKLMKRTGAEALQTATETEKAKAWTRGQGRNQAGFKVTTIRFSPEQWVWLRDGAHARALESGAKADASEIVRELVDAAMNTKKEKGRNS